MKNLVELFYNWYSNNVRHPKYRWIMIFGTLLYLLSPIDISSDFMPIIGWIGDGVVLTILTTELSRLLIEKRKSNQAIQENEEEIIEAKVVG